MMPERRPRMIAVLAGSFVFLVGVFVLVGWALDIEILKTIFPDLVTMKANTAAGLMLGGLGLAFLSTGKSAEKLRFGTSALALVVGLLGALSLSEYFFGWNLGLDQLLFHDAVQSVGTSQPGRMAPSTAFSFVLVGGAVWVAARQTVTRSRAPILGALGTNLFLIGGVAVVGQISNALFGFRLWNYFGMAIHTALGFCLLGLGLLAYVREESEMNWALNRPITLGFILSIFIMLTAAGISWDYTHRLQDSVISVSQTHEILKDIEEIRADKATLESGQRGFIILGDEQMLANRPTLKAEVRLDLAHLRRLTADDPQQQKWLDELVPLMAQRTIFSDQLIATRREEGFPAAEQMLATGPGLALSAEIARIHQEMLNEEMTLLTMRQEQANDASTVTFLVLPLAGFLSLTLLALAMFSLNQRVREQELAETKLKGSLKEITDLQAALDEHSIVVVTDPTGKITYVNDKFCAISGYAREELIGQDHRIINSGYHSKAFIRELWATISWGKVWQGEIQNRAKDGSVYWVDTTIVPFLNDDGKPRQYVAIRTDITERKRTEAALRESELQFRTMADAIPQLTWMAHPDGSIYWYNQRWYDYTGTTPADMEDEGWKNVHDPEVLPKVMENWQASLSGGVQLEMEFPLRARNGDYGWFLTRVIPLKDDAGRVVRWFGTNTDVTEMRKSEDQIRNLNTTLEMRVAERTLELETANKELEAFSYSVSHDLRAPLRAVDGFSQAVIEDYGPGLPAQGLHYLKTIRQGAQRMGMLIDDLLTFSRLSRAPLHKRPVNTEKLIRGVVEELRPDMEGRQVDIRIASLPECLGDSALLKQVWLNLIGNAVKYTRKKEQAIIEIGCESNSEDVYFIRDNGAGFEMRYAKKLFGVFQRMHRADQFEGTGVGLAIVQRIVHRHGGHIWADAKINAGASFHFALKRN